MVADAYDTEYNRGEGVDVETPHVAIEVETPASVHEAPQQLQGYRKRVYIAGSNQDAVEKAKEVADGTTIGVMNRKGEIIESSSR
jgi:hypothetical protein